MFKKISIVLVFYFGMIAGFATCYMHYKDKIIQIPKQSTIDESITKFYPEYDLLEYISDITDGTETLDTIGKAFDIEYMQETEDKDKCYIVLKSLEGGYFFIFFEKKGDKYFSTTSSYFKDYVPLANEYVNNLTRIDHKYSNNDFSGYEDVVNLYWYIPYDQYGKFMGSSPIKDRGTNTEIISITNNISPQPLPIKILFMLMAAAVLNGSG